MVDEDVKNVPVWKILFIFLGIGLSVVSSTVGYLTLRLIDVNDRLVRAESSHCALSQCSSISSDLRSLSTRFEWHSEKINSTTAQCISNSARLAILERGTPLKRAN